MNPLQEYTEPIREAHSINIQEAQIIAIVESGKSIAQSVQSLKKLIKENQWTQVAKSSSSKVGIPGKSPSSEITTKKVRGISRSPDSDRNVGIDAIKGGTKGGGDHSIPDMAIKEALRSIVEDNPANQVIERINALSNAMNLGDVCNVSDEVKVEFAKLEKQRNFRKELTQRIRGTMLASKQLQEIELGNYIEQQITAQELDEAVLGRVKDLLNFTSNITSNQLETIRESLYTKEQELAKKILEPIYKNFSQKMDQRETGKFAKNRVTDQRTEKRAKVETFIAEFEKYCHQNSIQWNKSKEQQGKARYKLKILSKIKDLQLEGKDFISQNLLYDNFEDIERDVEYYNRTDAEGTKVNMAMKGLRAFNKLIEISNEKNPDIKKRLISNFIENKELLSGLLGTQINPAFESFKDLVEKTGDKSIISKDVSQNPDHPLWNIIGKQTKYSLPLLCQRTGSLLDKTIDFERKTISQKELDELKNAAEESDLPQELYDMQVRIDNKQLNYFYIISAESVVFLFQTFKHLQKLSPKDQAIIYQSFFNHIIQNQGLSETILDSGSERRKNQSTLTTDYMLKKVLEKSDLQVYSMLPQERIKAKNTKDSKQQQEAKGGR